MKLLRSSGPGWLIVVVAFVLAAGCKSNSAGDKDKNYDIKAKVVAVSDDKESVTLDHEDIPGLMKAMTMRFKVEDAQVLEGIKPGDSVEGRLKVKGGGHTITELKKKP